MASPFPARAVRAAPAEDPVHASDVISPERRRIVMACASAGIALAGLDSAVANIALPTIARDLAVSDASAVWVVNSYQIALAIGLLPAAALGESLGLKRVFAAGFAVFILASLGCALAPSLPMLVAARLVQGLGASCMAALIGALVRSLYPRRLLAKAISLVAACLALAAAAGPPVASLTLAVGPWPWLFLINVPVGAVAVLFFLRAAPRGLTRPRPPDLPGMALSAAAIGCTTLGVVALGGHDRSAALAGIVAGVGAAVTLVLQQRRRDPQLLPLDLLRLPLFGLSIITSTLSYTAQIMALVCLPFLLQAGLHRSTLATGLLVVPWPIALACAASLSARLASRVPATVLASVGLATFSVGLLLLALLPVTAGTPDVLWRMAVCGVGFGVFQTPNNVILMTAGPQARSGAASGMAAVARALGWSLGSALVAVVLATDPDTGGRFCLFAAAGLAAAGGVLSVARSGRGGRGSRI